MIRSALITTVGLALSALAISGCGDSEIGAAPVVKVTPEQRAKDLNHEAESTVQWLEGLSPEDRKAALARTPQVRGSLDQATDPALKTRIAALGL